MQIVTVANPFERRVRDVRTVQYKGQSLLELLDEHFAQVEEQAGLHLPREGLYERIALSVNGLVVPRAFWASTRPREGDCVVIMPVVGKKSETKQILNAVAMIAAMVVVGPAAPGMIEAFGRIGAFVLGTAAVVGTGVLLQSLTPSPKLRSAEPDWDASPTYGWSPATAQRQGLAIPRFYGRNKLYGNVVAVHTEVDGSDDTKQRLKMLVALGEGPVEGVVAGSIKINGQPAANFSDVTTEERRGTLNQTAVSFFDETKPEYRPNRVVTNTGGSVTYTTPDDDFDDLEIELGFTRGLYYANDQGGLSSHSVGVKIELSVHEADSWSTLVETTISDATNAPKRASYRTGTSYPGGSSPTVTRGSKYDIRITKTTSDQSSARYADELRLLAVREVLDDDFAYPGIALLGVSALATDQLSGSVTVSCVQDGRIVNTYDGSSWTLQHSDNPAWVLWDILTRPVISGDGSTGSPYAIERYDGIPPSRLDSAAFYELAQFCDQLVDNGKGGTEKRITFNGGWDAGTTVWRAAMDVCAVARCSLVWNGANLTVAIDKADTPAQMFTVADIIQDSYRQMYMPQSELASEIEVHYRDADQDYERIPFSVVEPAIPSTASRITLDLVGVTKQSEAWRAAMHRLAKNRYLKSTVQIDADIDAIACTVGDVVYLQHDVPEWGQAARVASAPDAMTIIADKDLTYEPGQSYEVMLRKQDGALNQRSVSNLYSEITGVDTSARTFSIAGDYSAHYRDGDSIRVANSTGNDGTYTVSGNATAATGETVITVVEDIPDSTADGGLFNQRRVVVTLPFTDADGLAEAAAEDDMFYFGRQNIDLKKYRVLHLARSSEQRVSLTLIEYNENVYGPDGQTPTIPVADYSPPDSDLTVLGRPRSFGELRDLVPFSTVAGPKIDVPLTTNLAWSGSTAGSVYWSAADGTNPILGQPDGVPEHELAVVHRRQCRPVDCVLQRRRDPEDHSPVPGH